CRYISVLDLHFFRPKYFEFTTKTHNLHTYNPLERLHSHRSCIHSKTATHASRNAFHPLKPPDSITASRSRNLFQTNACPRLDVFAFNGESDKIATRKMNDNARDTTVSDQQVRATSDNHHR